MATPKLGVQIVGDAVGLKAALGESTAATQRWATATEGYTVRVAESFKGITTAALQAQVAQDKLAMAVNRHGVGSLGAAQATVAYRRQMDTLAAASLAQTQKIGRNLTTYVSLPLAAVGYAAAKMAVGFNQQMLLIQTQAGASAKEVQNLSGKVLDLAKITPQGPEELAQGLYHLESIGLRGQKALDTLRISALAAGMGIANLEDTATALGGVVVTGIQGAQNYQTAMATLTATVGAGNMRFEDLAGSIGNIAPAAAAAGVTLPELGAAMATLTDRGFSADEAATRLRMSLALIQSPSEKAKKALKDMGVNANDLGAMLRQPNGLLNVLQTLNDAMEKVGQVRGNRDILAGFGGGRSGLGIQTLVQSLDQGLSSYQQKLADVSAGEQKYAANQKAYLESPAYKLHSAISTVESDLTKLGGSLLPGITSAFTDFGKAVDVVAKAFDALPEPAQKAFGMLVGELAIGGPLLLGLVAARKAVRAVATEFGLMPAKVAPVATETGAEIAAGVGAGTAKAEADVAALEAEIAALGPAAATAGAAAGSELATGVGAGVTTAEAGVASLRLSLLGLGGLAIAPIVVPVVAHWIASGRNNPISKAIGSVAHSILGPGDPNFTYQDYLDALNSDRANGPALAATLLKSHGYTSPSQLPGSPLAEVPNGQLRGDLAPKLARAAAQQAAQQAAAAKAGTPTTPTTPTYTPSRVAELNLALAKNPNDRSAINAKLAYDQAAAAFAEKRIKEGKGNKELVQQLENVYNDESSLTSRLKSLGSKAKKDAKSAGEFKLPLGLQIKQAAAALTAETGDDVQATDAIRAYVKRMLKSGRLSKQGTLEALQELQSLQTNTTKTFEVPLKLQLAEAKANASGVKSDQVKAAEAIKKWAETIVHSKHATTQTMIDAFNLIAQENSVIGVHAASEKVKESSRQFVSGIQGLSRAQKLALEQRFAQVQAHNGFASPHTVGAGGHAVNINGPIHVHGVQDAGKFLKDLQRRSKNAVVQTRGRHGGVSVLP